MVLSLKAGVIIAAIGLGTPSAYLLADAYSDPSTGGCILCPPNETKPDPPPNPVIVGLPIGSKVNNGMIPPGCPLPPGVIDMPEGHGETYTKITGKVQHSLNLLAKSDDLGIDLLLNHPSNCSPKLVGFLDGAPISIDIATSSGAKLKGSLQGYITEGQIGGEFDLHLDVGTAFQEEGITNTLLHELEHIRERRKGPAGATCAFDRSNDPACATEEEIAVRSKALAGLCKILCEGSDLSETDKKELKRAIEQEKKWLQQELNATQEGPDKEDCPYCTIPWAPSSDPDNPCGCPEN